MSETVIFLLLANAFFSHKGITSPSFLDKYKFQIAAIQSGERIRMLSAGFLHADYVHLAFNMYALYLFAPPVLNNLGDFSFLAVYFGSLVLGNLWTFYRHKNTASYSAVGASGAVSGIVYSAILLYPEMTLYFFPIPIPLPGYVFGVGYLLYSIYGMKKQLGNVGHSAHLGGAVGGVVLTVTLFPQVVLTNSTTIGLLMLPVLGLFLFGRKIRK